MWTSDRTHALLVALLVLVVIVASCGALLAYRTRASLANIGTRIATFNNPAYEIQRDAIDVYLRHSQRIQQEFGARQISRNEALRRALALVVPPVLQERHLQWVGALRAKHDAAAAVLVHEYAAIAPLE